MPKSAYTNNIEGYNEQVKHINRYNIQTNPDHQKHKTVAKIELIILLHTVHSGSSGDAHLNHMPAGPAQQHEESGEPEA